MRFVVKAEIPGITGFLARLMGKQPADTHVWVLGGEAPAFARQRATLCGRPYLANTTGKCPESFKSGRETNGNRVAWEMELGSHLKLRKRSRAYQLTLAHSKTAPISRSRHNRSRSEAIAALQELRVCPHRPNPI